LENYKAYGRFPEDAVEEPPIGGGGLAAVLFAEGIKLLT